jgi:protein-S-isoprenylcysteine O-methyltransferase Ste14
MWGVAYAVLVAALVVRVHAADAPLPAPVEPAPDEPLWLTRLHHALLLLVLCASPLERLAIGGADDGRALGALLFAGGVSLYRVAGRTLGEALSPFTEPRRGAPLVTGGLYRYLRHPMYLSQAMIAVGAPLTLGSRYTLAAAVVVVVLLLVRLRREERALTRTFPDYSHYAARTKRLLPFVY